MIERTSEEPSGIAPAAEPAGEGREPLKEPQETQSKLSQQAAPPAGLIPGAAAVRSALTPNCVCAAAVAIRIDRWLCPLATAAVKL